VTHEQNNTLVQQNTANINNTLDLTATTGDNSTSRNTGGDNSITTGDANVVANIVNFVNNNISGSGKLFVTFVNVFGDWNGNFKTPWAEEEPEQEAIAQNNNEDKPGIGGTDPKEDNSSSDETSAPVDGDTNEHTDAPSTETTNTTPYPTAQTILASVFADATNNGEEAGTNPQVASAFVNDNDVELLALATQQAHNPVTINLAWILLLIPFLGIWGVRKLYLLRRSA
jgi:hypothetical protein